MITIEQLFDRSAKNYHKTEERQFEPVNIRTLELAKKYLKPDDIILDFGCATGTKAIELSGSVQEIHGIDISGRMIEIAVRKATEKNIQNIYFKQSTIFDPEYRKGSFDAILAFNILHLPGNAGDILRRINELLKPDGLFISITTCLAERKSFLMSIKFLPVYLISRTGFLPDIKAFKFEYLNNLINDTGFQIIETETMFHGLSFRFIAAGKK